MEYRTDFLIIGTGIAGLFTALKLSDHGKVLLLSKRKAHEGNTSLAQGGIAAVFGDDDSFEEHIEDTLAARNGLCSEEAVRIMVESAPGAIN